MKKITINNTADNLNKVVEIANERCFFTQVKVIESIFERHALSFKDSDGVVTKKEYACLALAIRAVIKIANLQDYIVNITAEAQCGEVLNVADYI